MDAVGFADRTVAGDHSRGGHGRLEGEKLRTVIVRLCRADLWAAPVQHLCPPTTSMAQSNQTILPVVCLAFRPVRISLYYWRGASLASASSPESSISRRMGESKATMSSSATCDSRKRDAKAKRILFPALSM